MHHRAKKEYTDNGIAGKELAESFSFARPAGLLLEAFDANCVVCCGANKKDSSREKLHRSN
jgi:hypothetical protein